MVRGSLHPDGFEKHIMEDPKLIFTLTSYALILITYINLNMVKSAGLGIAISIPYFLINGFFLASAFFRNEGRFLRLTLGVLLFIMLSGFVGWLVMVIYNLDVLEFSFVMFTVSTFSSLMNREMRNRNVS